MALCKVQWITYTKLASAFDNEAGAGSSLSRIQRLIAECVINTDLIVKLILKFIPVKGPLRCTSREGRLRRCTKGSRAVASEMLGYLIDDE